MSHAPVRVTTARAGSRPGGATIGSLLVAALVLLTVGAVSSPAQAREGRSAGPVALYTFHEGSGRVVHDVSGVGRPLDLRVRMGTRADWRRTGLVLRGRSGLASTDSARELVRRLRASRAVTVEVWLRTLSRDRTRMAPIVSLTGDGRSRRQVLLGKSAVRGTPVFASRTRARPAAGQASLLRSRAPTRTRLTHVVFTTRASGSRSIFVDGRRVARGSALRQVTGPFGGQRLVLGGALGGTSPWRGELRRLAVYDRALSPTAVSSSFERGPKGRGTGLEVTKRTKPAPGAPTPTPVSDPTPTGSTGRPLLLKHGWDMPSPRFVRDHVTAMETMPFDGVTIALPGLGDKVQRQTPVPYAGFRDALAPLAQTRFTTMTHNFVTVYATPAGSVFDDWSVPVANFGNLARAAREAGAAGILYDNEEYFGSVSDFPGVCPGHTLVQCQDQARLRGRQVMDAMRQAWPDITVMTLYGPWVSEPKTYDALSGVLPFNDVSHANELMGPFFVGLAESAAGSPARVIDGGEIYSARTKAQFAAITSWQMTGMPARSSLVPPSLSPAWTSAVRPGVGVYDYPWLGAPMDVATMRSTVTNALSGGSAYVWVYTERHDWWGTGWPSTPVPASWVDAVRGGRSAALG
jgi:hypothetical protein